MESNCLPPEGTIETWRGRKGKQKKVHNFILNKKEERSERSPSQVFNPTRKRYIMLNAKIARTKPIKLEEGAETFLGKSEGKVGELWSRCSNKRRHYPMKLSVSSRKINKRLFSCFNINWRSASVDGALAIIVFRILLDIALWR